MHIACFALASIALLATDLIFSETRWFHWPVMVWGTLFCAHALYCKSLSVDDEWVEERTNKIRRNSYDLGHILSIEDSYKKDTPVDEPEAGKRE